MDTEHRLPLALTRFIPFRRLNTLELVLTAHFAHEVHFCVGEVLARIGESESDEIFLLEGQVQLLARDGGKRSFAAGSTPAAAALAQLRPRQYDIIALSAGVAITMPAALIAQLNASISEPPYQLSELELSPQDDDDRMFAAMLQDLARQTVPLPLSRQGAATLRAQLHNPHAGLIGLAQAAMVEPAVAMRLLGAANHSVFFSTPVQSCMEAVARLGETTSRRLLQWFCAPEFVPDRYSSIANEVASVVQSAREVAFLSAQLAEMTPGMVASRAYEVGLLHGIGELAALAYAEHKKDLSMDPLRLRESMRNARSLLGTSLLREFGLNGDFVMAASAFEQWQREVEGAVDYCDLVILAQLHCAIGTARARELPALNNVAAFSRVAMGELTPSHSLAMIRIARAQAETAQLPVLKPVSKAALRVA